MDGWFAVNHQHVVCFIDFWCFFFLMVDVQFVASNEHKMMKDDRNGAWN